jgi:tetratricopeptide (TPR) repeat protein
MLINKILSSQNGHDNSYKANKTLKSFICIFLLVSTLAVYSQVQDHDFINYDDPDYVTENLNVKAGLTSESVYWAFTTFHFANWHPVTWLSHMLDYQLYGSNPKGHHLTNLLFHIASSLLLFIVLLRMTGAIWQSGFVAALFALHPFNVESVAWVAERKNVLSTFFWFLTMWAYVDYVEKPSIKRYGLVALFFALGLMSKPMLITLPFVLLMMDYWPLRRLEFDQEKINDENAGRYIDKRLNIWRLVREKIPLFLLAAGSSIATFLVQKGGGALQDMEVNLLSTRLTNAMVSYLEYLKKTVWPEALVVFYPHPGNTLAVWKGMLCGIILVGITTVFIKYIRRAPYLVFGWFWFLGTLVPVIQIVQTGYHGMADRYAYVPLIGIFIIVAWGLPELLAKYRYKERVLVLLTGIYIPILMVLTWNQVSHWKNSISIFKHTISVTETEQPYFAITHNNLGIALVAEGKTKEAISHYKKAIKLMPEHAQAHTNLGIPLYMEGEKEESIYYFRKAILLDPGFATAHNNLGYTLFLEQNTEEAISHYKKAIQLKPDFVAAHVNLKRALRRLEDEKKSFQGSFKDGNEQ